MPRPSWRSLNRTFYGIETNIWLVSKKKLSCLNRTFYGIETDLRTLGIGLGIVLIVPFMELKRTCQQLSDVSGES